MMPVAAYYFGLFVTFMICKRKGNSICKKKDNLMCLKDFECTVLFSWLGHQSHTILIMSPMLLSGQ